MTARPTQPVRPLPDFVGLDPSTTAGSYFISNYPDFSLWTPQHVPDFLDALESPPRNPRADLGLYVHIPFCRKRCHFCYFKVYTDRNAAAIQQYLDAVAAEAAIYGSKPFLGDRQLRFVYFGGGTPSYLSVKQLESLWKQLKKSLPWADPQEVAFEAEPGTLNEKKVRQIRDIGVTRLSFGVENFSDHVLAANNRAHESGQIYAAYQWALDAGFPQINIDLIAGMLEETDDNWVRNIDETIRLAPDCVTIYQMEIPFNTTIYKQMKAEGRLSAPVADWPTKRRWVKYAFERLEAAGYTVTSGYTAVRDPKTTRFIYRDSLWTGADMIALGVSSFGHINHTHYQNEKNIDRYVEILGENRLPIHRALPITDRQALVRQMLLQLKLGALDRRYFLDRFGVDIVESFAEPFHHFADAGFLTIDPRRVTLSRDALLQVDHLIHQFLRHEHQPQPAPVG